jgi:hypothetical protein
MALAGGHSITHPSILSISECNKLVEDFLMESFDARSSFHGEGEEHGKGW